LNCWVTETNAIWCLSNLAISCAKSSKLRLSRNID